MNALRAQIRETAQQSMHDVRAQLDQAKAMLRADEESPLIAEAERLISQEQNYAVAEDYIHRFRNGERALPFETSNDAIEHFLRFISDDEFPHLYGFCERNKQDPMPRWAVQYMKKIRRRGGQPVISKTPGDSLKSGRLASSLSMLRTFRSTLSFSAFMSSAAPSRREATRSAARLQCTKQNRIWQIIATPFPSSAHR